MASLTKQKTGNRKGWRLRVYFRKRRRSLWLGDVSKRIADGLAYNLDKLVQAREAGQEPDADTLKWLANLGTKHRNTLTRWGLAEATGQRQADDPRRTLEPFIDSYISDRTDVKPITIQKYKQTKRMILEFFESNRPLKTITSGDAHRWKRWMLSRAVKPATGTEPAKTMAPATVSKHVKRAKTMFRDAVRDQLLAESPFADLKGCSETNKERRHFVDRKTTEAVLIACPNHEWRLIFALPRYAGMRCPTEVCGLKWSDILWDQGRIRIDAVKTGLRFCPIFPELLPILEAAFDDAPAGAVYCVGRYGGRASRNLATNLHRIIKQAGEKPWAKTFVNLRSTRRTELQEAFPSHVVDEWLGHSSKVAEDHYLQVTSDHWSAAATKLTGNQNGGPTGGPISAKEGPNQAVAENDKHGKNRVLIPTDTYSKNIQYPQQDSNLQHPL